MPVFRFTNEPSSKYPFIRRRLGFRKSKNRTVRLVRLPTTQSVVLQNDLACSDRRRCGFSEHSQETRRVFKTLRMRRRFDLIESSKSICFVPKSRAPDWRSQRRDAIPDHSAVKALYFLKIADAVLRTAPEWLPDSVRFRSRYHRSHR